MPMLAAAQSADALRNANSSGRNVVSVGLGYDLERYSPLRQINTLMIESLVARWAMPTLTQPVGEVQRDLLQNFNQHIVVERAMKLWLFGHRRVCAFV